MTCIGLIMETVSAMVSSVDLSTRINSTKLALKAIKEQEDNSASTSSPRTAILDSYGIDTSPSSTNTRLTQLLAQYAQVSGTDAETDDTSTQAPSGDITQASFMTSLKATLEELSKDPSKATQAKAMLEALAAGTLTVSDPTEGAKIKAWDVEADKTTTSKTGNRDHHDRLERFSEGPPQARRFGLCKDHRWRLCRQYFRRQRIFWQCRQSVLLSDLAAGENRNADGLSQRFR
ncbi:hypothetical protein AGR1B_Cc90108 [Agrobacterium fabacearum S56]|nr:hypothetical protein AGR1B_Cc90108 [Agrobacterium fabacearum S56]